MRRISLILMTVAFGLGMLPAAGVAEMQEHTCLPVARDYFWLDLSRMGMGMHQGNGVPRQAAEPGREQQKAKAEGQQRTWSRRMRLVHLRHGGFPPARSMGCPSCRARSQGMMPQTGGADMAAAMRKHGMRKPGRWNGNGHGSGKPDALPHNTAIWLETPDNLIHRIDPTQPERMRFNARMWGQYRVFVHVDAGERKGVRHLHFAFLEMFAHGDDVDKKDRPAINGDGYANGQPVFFLQRLHDSDAQRYRTQTGEEVRFRLMLGGQPVKGACVVMITQKNWRNAKKTDENGEVSFFLIKETPSTGGWRARRRSEKYLVVAQHVVPAGAGGSGEAKATRYVATQTLRVRPSRLEWESRSTAFLLASFTVVAAGAAIAIRRVRRRCRREGRA